MDQDIYVDLLLNNSVESKTNSYVKAQFYTSVSQPILSKTNSHKLSIIRFTLDTESIPIFEAVMRNNTETIYSITMSYNCYEYTKYMDFIPQNLMVNDKFVYTYQFLIYMANQCFIGCMNGLNSLVALPNTTYPMLEINVDTEKVSLNLDSANFGYNEQNKINIYFNSQMYSLFDTLPANILNISGDKAVQINNIVSNNHDVLVQESSTTAIWSPVQSIVFTTNLLPVYSSITPHIQIYQDGNLNNSSSNFTFTNILTDFIGNNQHFTPYIQYNPSIYRWIALKDGSVIQNIDIQIYWLNKRTGQLHPLLIGLNGSASVKILISKDKW